jgi:hypothetical protein
VPANVTSETFWPPMLGEKAATPVLCTVLKDPEADDPLMTWNVVPAAGLDPEESTSKVPPTETDPDAHSEPVLAVPDGLLTVSSNIPAVCE